MHFYPQVRYTIKNAPGLDGAFMGALWGYMGLYLLSPTRNSWNPRDSDTGRTMRWVLVMHVGAYPTKALRVGLLDKLGHTAIKAYKCNRHKAQYTQ